MIRINTLLLFVCLMTRWVVSTQAQIPIAPPTAQTPNVAGLGLFGQVPVSYFTGVPQIEIPMYTLQDKGIKVPVALSYHASGFRPDAHPGWVGQSWNLSAGGAIYRTVNELQDEYNKDPSISPYYANAGYYFHHGVLNVSNWDQVAFMQSITRGEGVLRDTEPDEFSFSFPGGNGKFYMGADGQWKVKCDRPVKVSFNGQFLSTPFQIPPMTPIATGGYIKTFAGFTITDTDGIQYVFGGNTNAIEYSTGFFEQGPDEWTANAWYLTRIIHPDGGYAVDFTYERDNYINQLYTSIYHDLGTSTVSNGAFLPKCSSSSFSGLQYTGKLLAPVYLRTIQSSIGRISFYRSTSTELRYPQSVYDARYVNGGNQLGYFLAFLRLDESSYPSCLNNLQWKKLDQIRIENEFGLMLKAYNLSYNNNANERLTLLSVTEQGRDLGFKPSYLCSYDNSQPLPPYLANQTDHWGFYNNRTPDLSGTNYYQTYYTYREPNIAYLRAGTLNKITYPTGGVTEFTYEPHRYSKRLQFVRSQGIDPSFNTNTDAGGLRIAKIKSYDPAKPEQKTEKEYFYVTGYKNNISVSTLPSSGVLGGQTKYYFDDYRVNAANLSGVVYSRKVFSSQSVLPACNNVQGSHVGYSEVVEKDNNGGYTRYYFTNFDNGHVDESTTTLQPTRTAYEPFTSLEEERGKLTKAETYNSANVLVSSKQYQYIALNKTNEYVKSLKANQFVVCPDNVGVYVEEATAYRFYIYSYLPIQEINTVYDQNGLNAVSTSKAYTYTAQTRQLTNESYLDSKGHKHTTYYRYPNDVLQYDPGTTNPTTDKSTAYLVQHNIIREPSEIIATYSDDLNNEFVKNAAMKRAGATGSYTIVKPIDELFLKLPSQRMNINSYIFYRATGFDDGFEVDQTDPNLERRVAIVYNSYGQIIDYQKDGWGGTYLWGYHSNYLIAKRNVSTHGGIYSIAYSSFEESDKGNWTYNGTPVSDAGAPTGTKVYNLSSGSITNNVNPSLHYIIQYYKKSGAVVNINGVLSTKNVRTIGEWTLVEQEVAITSNPLTISGSGMIDELRMFPVGAQLETYTYDPLVGMTSMTGITGNITYYEYDEFQRLKLEKDAYGNILKRYDYQYQAPIQQ